MPRKLTRPQREPEPKTEADQDTIEDPFRDLILGDNKIEPLLYNTDDACFMLGKISKPMLFRLITNKKLHPVKLGSRSMFTKKELERYVRECAEESQTG